MIDLRVMPVGEFQSNSYLVVETRTQIGILIDPGDQAEDILRWVGKIKVRQILITHGHPDHVGGLDTVSLELGIPVGVHQSDAEAFDLQPDFFLSDGDRFGIGDGELVAVHIPGHTPGSVALRLIDGEGDPWAIVGDSIFPGGPGHTATPEALATSLASLARTVFTWSDETLLYPGHGGPTTVGAERAFFEAFRLAPLPPDLCGDVTWR